MGNKWIGWLQVSMRKITVLIPICFSTQKILIMKIPKAIIAFTWEKPIFGELYLNGKSAFIRNLQITNTRIINSRRDRREV
jgi:hypothetical protein